MIENPLLLGIFGSLIAGCATGLGGIPVLFLNRIDDRVINITLGFAAGVMLAASAFSLVAPGIDYGTSTYGEIGGVFAVMAGIIAGGFFIDAIDKMLPHEHWLMGHEGPDSRLRKIWLFIIAITIHNFPEGLAVGVGFGSLSGFPFNSEDWAHAFGNAMHLAIGIGLQNIPEGLAVAFALFTTQKYGRLAAFGIALLTGLVEPIGGFLGAFVVSYAMFALPFGMGFAAGAMIFVISDEIIPETHSKGHQRLSTYGILIGFIVMSSMDNLFG